MSQFSLTEICMHVNCIAQQWDWTAEKMKHNFCTQTLSDIVMWPEMWQLPCSVQLLVILKLQQAEKMCEKNVKSFELNIDEKTGEFFCDCVFFQFYNLLCQHFWQQKILYWNLLTFDMWAQYGFMWENCEFKIYESIETEYIVNNLNKEIEALKQCCLKVQKVLKSLRTQYYSLKKDIKTRSVELNVKNRVIWL